MADGSIQRAVPRVVLDAVKASVRQSSLRGERGFKNAPRSEDTLTGDWGSAMRTEWSEQIEANGYVWRWRIDYRKFSGGNQNSSEEKPTGADGIVQVEVDRHRLDVSRSSPSTVRVENVEREYSFRKGILFQAKRHNSTERNRLVSQLEVVEKLTPGEGLYVEFGPHQYRAVFAKKMVDVNGFVDQVSANDVHRLGDLIADQFLECKAGVEGMYIDFDSETHTLHLPVESARVREVQRELSVGTGLRVKVTAFRMERFLEGVDRWQNP